MRVFFIVSVVGLLLSATGVHAQNAPRRQTIVRAARLYDGVAAKLHTNLAVLVEGGAITAVDSPAALAKRAPAAQVIDLGDTTLMPGLIDVHTHILSDPGDYTQQLVGKSIAYRAIEATARARDILQSGFTTLRDAETEGAMYADADLARAIASGAVPGPRIFASTRGIAPTGGYLPRDTAWDTTVRSGAQLVDGVENIRKAVREQISNGAAWIKVYADFGMRPTTNPARPFRSNPNFTFAELQALVDEAHRMGIKVAAHAMGWDGIDHALRAGVDSIEHGLGLTDDLATRMAKQGTFLVPTLTATREHMLSDAPKDQHAQLLGILRSQLKRALTARVKIANGSDAGSYAWQQGLAGELALLVDNGLSPAQALRAATSAAGELLARRCMPEERDCARSQLGVIAAQAHADVIAVDGDPLRDVRVLSKVRFVMKAGVIYKSP